MSRKELKELKQGLINSCAVVTMICANGEAEADELAKEFEQTKLLSVKGHMDNSVTLSCRLPIESWQEVVEYFAQALDEYNTMMKGEEEES